MDTFFQKALKGLRLVHHTFFYKKELLELKYNQEESNDIIKEFLSSDKPCMIARYGTTETAAIRNYLSVKNNNRSIFDFITEKTGQWWWNDGVIEGLKSNAGFFPTDTKLVERYCELMLSDSKYLDVLGSFHTTEKHYEPYYSHPVIKIPLCYFEPDFKTEDVSNLWTQVLRGKKVLVIHPFAETIQKQYLKREILFKTKDLMPNFDLITIKAVQSIGGTHEYETWFEALEYMEKQISAIDFDICLLGCGAYGFPLAAYVKRMGKKAFHIGGALQLFFGIKGNRWENQTYYKQIMNEYWVRPSTEEKPKTAEKVENACYW